MIRPFALHSREQVGVDRGYRCRDARTPFAIDRLYARPSHQPQIPLRQGPCDVIDARTTQIQQPCLALHGYLAIPLNHRFPLGGGNSRVRFLKREFSIVSSPIFACSSRIRHSPSEARASPPKIPAEFSSSSLFQAITWVAWTWWSGALCATVFSPPDRLQAHSCLERRRVVSSWLLHGSLCSGCHIAPADFHLHPPAQSTAPAFVLC